jgi:hypothetical protein
MHPIEHFKTVKEHRKLVREHCFKLGLYRQGIMDDLSKYSPVEFWRGAKYYQGNRSPNNKEREETGRSMAWLHHKGRNKHHFEYWVDYIINEDGSVGFGGGKMPKRYIAEMFCDRIAACRVYQKEKYTDASAWEYYQRAKDLKHTDASRFMHDDTATLLERWLELLKDYGEDEAFALIRRELKDARY